MTTASPADGYWCENVVRSPDAGAQWRLGCCRAETPSHAMAWLRRQAARIAGALDPQPWAGPFPAGSLRTADPDTTHAGRVFRDWLGDLAYQEVQRQALEAGRRISANAGAPDHIVGTGAAYVYVSLSCRPLTGADHPTAAGWWEPLGGTLDVPSGVVFVPSGANVPPCPFPCTRCEDEER